MSIFTVQQQKQQQQQFSVSKSCSLPRIPQNRLPVVHILTSRSEHADEKVRERKSLHNMFKIHMHSLFLERRTISI